MISFKLIWYHVKQIWYLMYMISCIHFVWYVHTISEFILYDILCIWYHMHISYEMNVWYHISRPMISYVRDIIVTMHDIMSIISWMISYNFGSSHDIMCSLHEVGHLRLAKCHEILNLASNNFLWLKSPDISIDISKFQSQCRFILCFASDCPVTWFRWIIEASMILEASIRRVHEL